MTCQIDRTKIREMAEENDANSRNQVFNSLAHPNFKQVLRSRLDSTVPGILEDDPYIKGLVGQGILGDNYSQQEEAVAFDILFDIQLEGILIKIKRDLSKYDPENDDIFKLNLDRHKDKKVKPLIEDMRIDRELIKIDLDRYDTERHRYIYGSHFLDFNNNITPELISFVIQNHKDKPFYARLNPSTQQLLCEYIERPADPRLRDVNLHNGEKSSSKYVSDIDPNNRFEQKSARNNKGNLGLLAEEICFKNGDFMLTTVIHCDTDSAPGTNMEDVILNHLDVSINLYEGDRLEERLSSNLGQGSLVKANKRLHIFRIENIQYKYLVEYARMIMKSKDLVEEWINDQFPS